MLRSPSTTSAPAAAQADAQLAATTPRVSAELPEVPRRADFPTGRAGDAQYAHATAECERLESILLGAMTHRECGDANPNAPCMVDGVCSKRFPKPFQQATEWNESEIYPKYRRRAPEHETRCVCP